MPANPPAKTKVISGSGTASQLPSVLTALKPRRLLIVGGRTALARARIAHRAQGCHTRHFTDFTPNPQLADVARGCALAESYQPDLVLGVGGGSAMDVAKMIRLLPPDPQAALAALTNRAGLRKQPPPLILIPTTAGTGAEVTGFATVYTGPVKHSLDHPTAHANLALVDPDLTTTCPAPLTYSCALDALSHAIESTWSLRSTPHSRALAADALRALVPVLRAAQWPMPARTRQTLSQASTRAGAAIDITRTTAGHAFAYPLTAHHGVPHGIACALNLAWLIPHTAHHLTRHCQDPRGPAFTQHRLNEITTALGADTADQAGQVIASFLAHAGFPTKLSQHGVAQADLPTLIHTATTSQRSTNHPITLTHTNTLPSLRSMW